MKNIIYTLFSFFIFLGSTIYPNTVPKTKIVQKIDSDYTILEGKRGDQGSKERERILSEHAEAKYEKIGISSKALQYIYAVKKGKKVIAVCAIMLYPDRFIKASFFGANKNVKSINKALLLLVKQLKATADTYAIPVAIATESVKMKKILQKEAFDISYQEPSYFADKVAHLCVYHPKKNEPQIFHDVEQIEWNSEKDVLHFFKKGHIRPLEKKKKNDTVKTYRWNVFYKKIPIGGIKFDVFHNGRQQAVYVQQLAIHQAYRGKGLGSGLLKLIEEKFPKIQKIELVTTGITYKFYEKQGFVVQSHCTIGLLEQWRLVKELR